MAKAQPRQGPKSLPDVLVKVHGSVYTPAPLVGLILDTAGYIQDIQGLHLIDNSCGDGAFLMQAVERYSAAFQRCFGEDPHRLASELATYLHGIDSNPDALAACWANLDRVAAAWGVTGVKWDLRVGSALHTMDLRGRMDFVVGNPPYVRVHNLGASALDVRSLTFSSDGMTDLYLAFFDVGIQMLGSSGRLCLITASSWLTSKAARAFRNYLRAHRTLCELIDLGHHQPFAATTYTMITRIVLGEPQKTVLFSTLDPRSYRAVASGVFRYEDFAMGSGFYFAASLDLPRLRRIVDRVGLSSDPIKVRNGFATLADSVFIGSFAFQAGTISIVKASTGARVRCIFPYDAAGRPYSEEEFAARGPEAMNHLHAQRGRLERRAIEAGSPWHLFGRSQALRDLQTVRYAVNSLLRAGEPVRLVEVQPGEGVYGGLYLRTQIPAAEIRACLSAPIFFEYVRALRKYKSGGYFTYSAEDLSRFLNDHFGTPPTAGEGVT